MADAVLHVKVDPSGAVVGSTAASVSLDKLSAAAARSNAATNMLTSAFTSSNVAARNVEVSLRSMLREQTGLARAYAAGSDAVKQYNLQLKIESVLAEAGVAANTMRGRAIAAQVAQLDQLITANQAAAAAQREADAAADKMGGGLSGLMGKVFGVAAALALLKSTVTDFAHAALEAEDAERRLASAVERRGAAFKMSASELVAMSTKLERASAFEDDAIQKAQAVLLRFGEIDASNLERVTKATLDFAEATGQDAASAAVSFGKALLVPGEAMRALKEVGVTLTQSQQDMVDAWNQTGQGAKSVALLVDMVNSKIGGEAEKAATTGAGGIKQFTAALGNLKEMLGAGLIPDLSGVTIALQGLVDVAKRDNRGLFKAFFFSNEELHQWYLAKVAADDLARSIALVGERTRHVSAEPPPVKPKTKEEIEAAKRAAEEYAAKLQAIVDKANPFSAAARKMAEDVALLKEAFKVLKIPVSEQPAMIARLTGDWAGVGEKLREVELQAIDTAGALDKMREIKSPEIKATMTIEHVEIPKTASEQALADLKSNLEQSVTGAFSYGIAAFLSGSKDAAEQFGDALKGAFINAVSEYLSRMLVALAKELAVRLANAAKEAAARNAGAAGGGGGGGGAGSLSSLFGGSSAMSGLGTFAAVVGVFAAAVAVFKHQTDRHEAVQYGTISGAVATGGAVQYDYTGKLDQTGPQVAAAIGSLLNAFQEATGAFILGTATAEVQIRNDKERFRALVNGVLVGEFETVNEAIIAAAKGAFLGSNLSAELDPILAQVIGNFKGTDPQALIDALNSVRAITDELSGLSEIEVRLRDLPTKVAAMSSELMRNGVAYDDARALAERWRVSQLADIRDELTGRQKTNAELMAEQERKAAMYNAEVTLLKAETQLKRDELAARIAALEASGNLFEGQVTLDQATITAYSSYLQAKNEIFEQEVGVNQWYLETMGVAANASLLTLKAQLAALDAMLANMPDLIAPGEIRLPRGHGGGHGGGGGLPSGPSEAEQRAQAFADFLENMRLDGLTGYQRALAELDAAFAEQVRASHEVEGGEEALAAARRAATARLREELIDQLGLPMEAVRDRFAQMQQQAADFYASNVELQRQFDAGEISIEEFTAAVQRSQQIQRELRNQALSDVASMALYFTDALGFDEESAQIRQVLAQLEWEFKLAEFKLAVEQYYLMKRLTDEQYAYLNDLIDRATNAGPPPPPPPPRDQNSGVNDARDEALNNLTRALDRLRSIVQTYTDFLRGLQTSESSPYSIEQQYNTAQAEYQRLLALAQAGNLDAIEALPNAAQTYLDLAAQMFGTASAGYAQIFEGINTDMSDILGGVQSILDSVPTQFRPMEERLDTIAEILQNMYLLQGGTAGTGGGANPHAGLVYYGPEWGWHPMGWSPGGNTPPSTGNFAANAASPSLTNANGVGQPLAETNRHLQVIAAQQARAAKLQASDRYRKPKLSYAGYAGGRSAGERKS